MLRFTACLATAALLLGGCTKLGPDFVRPDQTGLLAPVGDSMELGSQIRYLAEHRDQAQAMGDRAREIAVAEYSDEREAKDYVQLYADLLKRDGRSS